MARQPNTEELAAAQDTAIDKGAAMNDSALAAAKSTVRAGLRTAADATDRAAAGTQDGLNALAAEAKGVARQSQKSFAVAASAGGAVIQGAQDISQAWMDLAQGRIERMAESMRALAMCRSPADLLRAQGELMREAMEQMLDTNRRVTDVSMRVMQEVNGQIAVRPEREP